MITVILLVLGVGCVVILVIDRVLRRSDTPPSGASDSDDATDGPFYPFAPPEGPERPGSGPCQRLTPGDPDARPDALT